MWCLTCPEPSPGAFEKLNLCFCDFVQWLHSEAGRAVYTRQGLLDFLEELLGSCVNIVLEVL